MNSETQFEYPARLPLPPRMPSTRPYPVPDVPAPRDELIAGTWRPDGRTVRCVYAGRE